MPGTTGLVQRVTLVSDSGTCCIQIGPSPSNTTLFFIQRRGADTAETGHLKTAMIEGIVSAQISRREVTATHATNDAEITSLAIGP